MTAHRLFDPEHDGPMLSGYADGELDAADRELVEAWLMLDERAREELARVVRLKAFTDHLVLRQAPAEAWDEFHQRRLHRDERGLAWTLISVAALLLGAFLLPRVVAFMTAGALPIILRLGLIAAAAGLLLLLVSVVRERFFTRKRDRYDDVIR